MGKPEVLAKVDADLDRGHTHLAAERLTGVTNGIQAAVDPAGSASHPRPPAHPPRPRQPSSGRVEAILSTTVLLLVAVLTGLGVVFVISWFL